MDHDDSLLPRSLFAASTLKRETVQQTVDSALRSAENVNDLTACRQYSNDNNATATNSSVSASPSPTSRQQPQQKQKATPRKNTANFDYFNDAIRKTASSTPSSSNVDSDREQESDDYGVNDGDNSHMRDESNRNVERIHRPRDGSSISSSSSSSSSNSSEDEEGNSELEKLDTFAKDQIPASELFDIIQRLQTKLEKQHNRQIKYQNKLKQLNRTVNNTNKLLLYHAKLLANLNQNAKKDRQEQDLKRDAFSSTIAATYNIPQVAKRSKPFNDEARGSDDHDRLKQRRLADDKAEAPVDRDTSDVDSRLLHRFHSDRESISSPPVPSYVRSAAFPPILPPRTSLSDKPTTTASSPSSSSPPPTSSMNRPTDSRTSATTTTTQPLANSNSTTTGSHKSEPRHSRFNEQWKQHVNQRQPIEEIPFATKNYMDVFTISRRTTETVFSRKPRSILSNIASSNMDSSLRNLMVTTDLNGELQFWNTHTRKNIKTIGKQHLYDTWIEDICWVTPTSLAFCPSSKEGESVKVIHLDKVTSSNVTGRIQKLDQNPHDKGISVISSAITGDYSTPGIEKCSFVTGGNDKNVYLWNLKRDSPEVDFTVASVSHLYIKHTNAVHALHFDKYKNYLCTGGADNRFFIYDLQTSSLNRELKLNSRITQIIPSPINPNIALITTAGRSEQFIVFDQRLQGYDGITLKFGQQEGDNLSRYVRPDIHQNGYVVCCGSQSNAKLNFWDLRSRNVIRGGPSFSLDTGMSARILRSVFLPYKNTVVSTSSYRELAWLDYNVKKDEMIQTL